MIQDRMAVCGAAMRRGLGLLLMEVNAIFRRHELSSAPGAGVGSFIDHRRRSHHPRCGHLLRRGHRGQEAWRRPFAVQTTRWGSLG